VVCGVVFSHLGVSGKNVHEMIFWNVDQLFFLSVKYSLEYLTGEGHILIHDPSVLVNWENSLDGSWPTG